MSRRSGLGYDCKGRNSGPYANPGRRNPSRRLYTHHPRSRNRFPSIRYCFQLGTRPIEWKRRLLAIPGAKRAQRKCCLHSGREEHPLRKTVGGNRVSQKAGGAGTPAPPFSNRIALFLDLRRIVFEELLHGLRQVLLLFVRLGFRVDCFARHAPPHQVLVG